MKKVWSFLKKLHAELPYEWLYIYNYTLRHMCIPENWKHMPPQKFTHTCSQWHYSQQLRSGHNPEVHQTMAYPHQFKKDWMSSSHKQSWSTEARYNLDEPWKHHGKWKKSDTKGDTRHDSFSMKYLEQANPERQKADWWLPGDWEGDGECDEKVLQLDRWWLHSTVNALNTTEMYTLK